VREGVFQSGEGDVDNRKIERAHEGSKRGDYKYDATTPRREGYFINARAITECCHET
jgi:hypothetical protein